MPYIQVTLLEGRTIEQKRKLAERITKVFNEEAGTPPEAVSIAFIDVARDSYATGGVLMADKKPKT